MKCLEDTVLSFPDAVRDLILEANLCEGGGVTSSSTCSMF
jgi:hypothetical protein